MRAMLSNSEAAAGRRQDHLLTGRRRGQLIQYIDDNLDRNLCVGELAQLAGLSPSYFSRAFKGCFGLPPHAYVLARRIEKAKLVLLGTDDAICDIALVCGLADQAHLTRTFRRQVGVPPGAWRRLRRGDAASAADTP